MHPRVRTETAPPDLGQATDPSYVRVRGIYFQRFGDEIWCFVRGGEMGFCGEGFVAGWIGYGCRQSDGDEHDGGSGRSESWETNRCE